MSATVIQFPASRRRQRGHFDVTIFATVLGVGALALGIGMIAAGVWLVWFGSGALGWRG